MKAEEYQKYRNSPKWKRIRAECMEKHGFRCIVCGCTWWRREVDTHHLHYRNVGNEKIEDLVPLCIKHHKMIHELDSYDMDGVKQLQKENTEDNWDDPLPSHIREQKFKEGHGTSVSELMTLRRAGEMVDNADIENAKTFVEDHSRLGGFEKAVDVFKSNPQS